MLGQSANLDLSKTDGPTIKALEKRPSVSSPRNITLSRVNLEQRPLIPDEAISSNARTVAAMRKTTDHSQITKILKTALDDGGVQGRAEVEDLIHQFGQYEPKAAADLTAKLDLGRDPIDGGQSRTFKLDMNDYRQPPSTMESKPRQIIDGNTLHTLEPGEMLPGDALNMVDNDQDGSDSDNADGADDNADEDTGDQTDEQTNETSEESTESATLSKTKDARKSGNATDAAKTSKEDLITPLWDTVDRKFIEDREDFKTDMYALEKDKQPDVKSGPTIGAGVDLGQMNKYDLKDLVDNHGLSKDTADKVAPYLGKKGQDATTFTKDNPLTLSNTEARELTDAKYDKIGKDLEKNYDRDMKAKGSSKRFRDLDKDTKTIALSLAINLGPNLGRENAAPRSWSLLLNDDKAGLINELNNFGGNSNLPRRKLEADYLAGKYPRS
ncbi:MAG: hypothetical protein COB59_05860 [Rhodospirillaceae bacterium]|nr:MAG: hypothetical protein COB59_05860 [Rhodospirillaceae bacterium]